MAALTWVWPERAERWRRPALIAASVAVHALVLGSLALRAFDATDWPAPPEEPFPDTVLLDITPRPLLEGEQSRVREIAPPPAGPAMIEPLPGAAAARPDLPFRLRDEDEEDSPTAPVPRLSAPAPGVAPPAVTADGAWAVRPEAMGDRVARSLRTSPVGCATPDRLGPADRNECERRFADAAARAAPSDGTNNLGRDAAFAREGARALAQYEGRRRPLAGGAGVIGVQEGPGSNFGIGVAGAHIDPSLRPDSTQNIRTRRDGPRASGAPLSPGASSARDQD